MTYIFKVDPIKQAAPSCFYFIFVLLIQIVSLNSVGTEQLLISRDDKLNTLNFSNSHQQITMFYSFSICFNMNFKNLNLNYLADILIISFSKKKTKFVEISYGFRRAFVLNFMTIITSVTSMSSTCLFINVSQ